ncbi:hypothetical protein X797_003644 [Metarhizium robertsii]|uniref:Uncharacterized protein n=1 Tax=Metarhizium robertsii TaxID=568076 RepID=A0A0A1V1X6_9HYPO|nr:hypothetical protein X797_003644 [Metarhizium robertsii]
MDATFPVQRPDENAYNPINTQLAALDSRFFLDTEAWFWIRCRLFISRRGLVRSREYRVILHNAI